MNKKVESVLTAYDMSLKEERGYKTVFFFVAIDNLIFTLLLLLTQQSCTFKSIMIMFKIQSDISQLLETLYSPAAFVIYMATIGGYLLLIILQHLHLAQTRSSHVFQRTLSEIYQYCLFMPIIFTLSYCLIGNFKQKNIINVVVILLYMTMCVFYNILQELVLFPFSMVSQDLLARNARKTYYLRSCLSLLAAFCFGCHQQQLFPQSFTILLVTGMLYYFILLYQCLVEMDEHKFVTSKIRLSIGLFFLSLLSWQLISYKLQVDLIIRNLPWITIIFYGFIISLSLNYRHYLVARLCMEVIDNIHNHREFLIKIRENFNFFVNFKCSQSKTLRSAVICSHFKDCHNVDCICRHREMMYDPTKREWSQLSVAPHNDHVFCKHFINMMYKEGLTKFKEFRMVTMSHIYALWDMFRLYQRVLKEMEVYRAMFQKQMNLGDQFLMHHLKILIFEYLRSRGNTTQELPVEQIEKFDNIFKKLKEHIHQLTQFHEMFWKELSQNIVDRKDLHKISNQICQLKITIQKQYEQALSYSNKSYLLMMMMHKYSTKIIFDLKMAQKVHKDMPFTVRERTDGSTYGLSDKFKIDEGTCTLKVSTNDEDFSQVQWTSSRFSALLGWQKQDIIGKPLENLMPPIYRKNHGEWIRSWKQRGTELNMNQIKKIWVMEQNKLLCSCISFIKVVPQFTHIQLVGMLKKSNERDYILLGQNCQIEAAGSRLCMDLLMVQPSILLQSKIPLYVFSPELARQFKTKSSLGNQTLIIHLLVPKNIENYISRFCYQRQFADSQVKQNKQKLPDQKQMQRLCYTMSQDLVTAAESLATIAQLTLSIQQTTHKTSTGKINLTVLKITECQILQTLPPILRQVQDEIKENTITRVNTIREERKTKEKVYSQVLCKSMSQRCSRYSIQKMGGVGRRKQISLVKSIMNKCTEETYKKVLTKDLSPKRSTIQKTRQKIKSALYRVGILGQSKFSYFYDRRYSKIDWGAKRSNKPQRTCRAGSIMSSKTLQMLYTAEKRIEESDKVQWAENQHQLTSIKSSLASDSADLDFEELKKRVGSNQQHASLKKYKIIMIIVMLFYIVERTVLWEVRAKMRESIMNMLVGLSEITQVSILLDLQNNSVQLMQLKRTEEVNRAALASNNRLATLLSQHSLLKTKTIEDQPIYSYLQKQITLKLPGDKQKKLRNLNAIKTLQLLMIQIANRKQLDFESMSIIQWNYQQIQQTVVLSFENGIRQLSVTTTVFRVMLLMHIIVSWLVYILLALLLWLYTRKGESWIELSLDMISSIPITVANDCCKYYHKLTENMKENKQESQSQEIQKCVVLTDLVSHRLNNSKGNVTIQPKLAVIVTILFLSLVELLTTNAFNLARHLDGFAPQLTKMMDSQHQLMGSFVKVKQAMMKQEVVTVSKHNQFIGYTQEAFNQLAGYDQSNQLRDSLAGDVCRVNYPLVLNLPSCNKKPINKYGLLLLVESLYSYLQNATKLTKKQFMQNPLLIQNELSVYYVYNVWNSVWQIFKEAKHRITHELVEMMRVFNILGYLCMFLVMVASVFMCRLVIKSVNKVNSHILIVPRRFLRENAHAKRLLKKFL